MFRNRVLPLTVCALVALAAMTGCRSHEPAKVDKKPEKKGPTLPIGTLLYSSQGGLWKLARGSGAEQVLAGPAWFPAINPDVNEAACWVDLGGEMALEIVNLVSRASVRAGQWKSLGSLGRNLNLRNAPAWVPGHDSILFADGRQIWQVDADGGNLQTVYEHPDGGCYSVTVSPAGDRLAFVGVTEKEQNLWTFSLKTRKAQALTDFTLDKGAVGGPAWSPKGDRIAFVLYKAEESNIYMMPADGGTPMMTTKEGRTNSPCWDPTGRKLAVSSGTQNPLLWQVALINPDDSKFLEQLTTAPAGAFAPSIAGAW